MSDLVLHALSEVLGPGTLEPHFQPIVGLQEGTPAGVEALARWRGSDDVITSANALRTAADRAGLRAPLAAAMTQAALAVFGASPWAAGQTLSLNATASDLEEGGFGRHLPTWANAAGVPLDRIWLELTEEERPRDMAELARTLNGLRRLGVRVAADDFGTGYAGLSWLLSLPLDGVKLDASFTEALPATPATAVAQAVAGLGAALNLRLTAEGIETDQQRTLLMSFGFGFGQGRLFGMPQAAWP